MSFLPLSFSVNDGRDDLTTFLGNERLISLTGRNAPRPDPKLAKFSPNYPLASTHVSHLLGGSLVTSMCSEPKREAQDLLLQPHKGKGPQNGKATRWPLMTAKGALRPVNTA